MQHNSKINDKKIESVWVDEIKGATLNAKNADSIAYWVGGSVLTNGQPFVSMPTPRGELLVREGDFVGKDQRDNWHLVRLQEVTIPTPSIPSVENVHSLPQKASKKAPKPGPKA